ncbi:MAG TPA: DUF4432 family protein [Streptosporangiaceae bacterium]|nr:DUF4432 family protein [Streptosporangiaceae bacterium]
MRLGDRAERGVRALEFRTGSGPNFDVLADQAMDIGSADYRGVGFGLQSATGFRHPGLHGYRDEDGLSWPRSFCGRVARAGGEHNGAADRVRDRYLASLVTAAVTPGGPILGRC